MASRTRTVHFVWNEVLEVLSDQTAEQGEQPNRRTPNTEQENNDNEQRRHLDNDNRLTTHLDIDFRPDFEQESNRTEHQTIQGLSNRKSTPDFWFRIEQSNSKSNSYSSSWFLTVARYLFESQDLRCHHG